MTIENNDQKKANSRFSHVKQFIALFDNIQGRILALAMTVSVVFGIVNNFTKPDQKRDETTKEAVHVVEWEKSPIVTEKKNPSPEPSKPAYTADRSVTEEGAKGNPAKDEDIVIPKTENPKSDMAEQQLKPNKPAQSEKPVKKSESKKKTATEPTIPAESAVKPMTAEERKKIVEEEKKKMDEAKKELDEKRKAEDPTGSSSKVKDDERQRIDEEAENLFNQIK